MRVLKSRDRDTIVQALRAGVVPKVGLRHIQVGRAREIEEMLLDVQRISEGGATIRFVIGDYGSGKTFFMNLVRLIALEKGLVVMFADLAPERRLYATGGQARGLYAEMARNLSTRTRPDGGAMASVVERFAGQTAQDAENRGLPVGIVIRERLESFEELTGGFEFAEVVRRYWEGHETGDDETTTAALRWLRGEYVTRTDARKALGVRGIVDDSSVYDHLKLMSKFVRTAGYKGLLVGLDEMVNLFKLTSSQARNANYEQILRIVNDVFQGSASHIGFIMGGTPEFLMNTRRGLYSYEALQSRLAENRFARDGLVDLSGPVLRLATLTPEEMFVLLSNVRSVMQPEDPLPDEALTAFMAHCSNRIGEAYFRTPRNTVGAFVKLLGMLPQNPGTAWHDLLERVDIDADHESGPGGSSKIGDGPENQPNDDGLTSFKL